MKDKAREFAIASHKDQKYGVHPYSIHLDAVATLAEDYGDLAVTIAYLHDVVEDTEVSLSQIESEFGLLVSQCVEILTDEPGNSRKERKQKTYEKMKRVSGAKEIALIVKVCDRLANVRACHADGNVRLLSVYKSEKNVFRSSVQREGLCDELWLELEKLLNV